MIYSDVQWGDTLCDDCRRKPADLLAVEDPLCIECADRRLDRLCAMEINRELGANLPPLLDRWTGKGYV